LEEIGGGDESMKISLLTVIFTLVLAITVFADIPIYCPKEKIHLYDYLKDEIPKGELLKAWDFKPVNENIPQPKESDPMVCPLCGAPLNGYEYWFWSRGRSLPRLIYPAFTFMTKN
jgi:hypothetical protein